VKKLLQNDLCLAIFCCLISVIFVYMTGQADIPNKGNRTNIFSFQDLDRIDYKVIQKGLPFKHSKTLYKSDPSDSCTKCNQRSSLPCTCGMPPQIYFNQINWPIAILNFLAVGAVFFLILRASRLLIGK